MQLDVRTRGHVLEPGDRLVTFGSENDSRTSRASRSARSGRSPSVGRLADPVGHRRPVRRLHLARPGRRRRRSRRRTDPRDAVLPPRRPARPQSTLDAVAQPVRRSPSGTPSLDVRRADACSPPGSPLAGGLLVRRRRCCRRWSWPGCRCPAPPRTSCLVVVSPSARDRTPRPAALVGFAGGLLLDLVPPADGTVGRWALVLTLVGWFAGTCRLSRRARGVRARSWWSPCSPPAALLATPGSACCSATRTSRAPGCCVLPAATLYDVVLTAFVVPAVGALARRTRRAVGPAASRW